MKREEFGAEAAFEKLRTAEMSELRTLIAVPMTQFLVAEEGTKIVGGAGIVPFSGGDNGSVCELRTLFLLPGVRGRGVDSDSRASDSGRALRVARCCRCTGAAESDADAERPETMDLKKPPMPPRPPLALPLPPLPSGGGGGTAEHARYDGSH